MKSRILLIQLPQTEFGQRQSKQHSSSQPMLRLQERLSDNANSVAILDAHIQGMHLFSIVRAIRRHAPQTVILAHQIPDENPVLSTNSFAGLLARHLERVMPRIGIEFVQG